MEERPAEEGETSRATALSILDHYTHRPSNSTFEFMTLLDFSQHCTMPMELGSTPEHHKVKIVSVRPYCLSDPSGPKYEQYCRQKLMLHVPFRHIDALKGTCDSFPEAYAIFLQTDNVPPSLEEDIGRLTEQQEENNKDSDQEVCSIEINAHL